METLVVDRPPTDPTSLVGRTLLDRYRIEALVGQGGMATVYAAQHVALDRTCAVKVLKPEFARDPQVVRRFLQEARATSRIRHPNVVAVTDFGVIPGDIVFMVMELLDGETLEDRIARERKMPWSRVRPIALQLCDALRAAHDEGVVHRDVTPANCFLVAGDDERVRVKLLDFGIARVTAGSAATPGSVRRLTSDTDVMGTPEFMSPEQGLRTNEADRRSDVYSLGAVLYLLLTGRVPFEASTPVEIVARHVRDAVPLPSAHEPTLAVAVERIILRALEKDPDRRFQTIAEMAAAIDEVPEHARREPECSGTIVLGHAEPEPEIEPAQIIAPSGERPSSRAWWAAAAAVVVAGGLVGRQALADAPRAIATRWIAPITIPAAIVEPASVEPANVEPAIVTAPPVPTSRVPAPPPVQTRPAARPKRATRPRPVAPVVAAPEPAPAAPAPPPSPAPTFERIEEIKNPFAQ